MLRKRWLGAGLLVASGALAASTPAGAANVYVANTGSATISQYAAGAAGALTPLSAPSVATDNGPTNIALSADDHNAYVTNTGTQSSIGLYVVGADGSLSLRTTFPITVAGHAISAPYGIALSADGKSAYVSDFQASSVSQFSVAADGTLSPDATPTVAAGTAPEGVALSPDGKSLYVVNSGDPSVSQYTVAADGTLTPKATATVPAGTNAQAIAVTPDGTRAYVANQGANTISEYTIAADGSLTPNPVAASIASGGNGPTGIAASPDGTSVYVSDKMAGVVAQFEISAVDGTLAPAAGSPFTAVRGLGEVALSADGTSLYVSSNQGGGELLQYTVGAGGALSPDTPLTVAAGTTPFGIAVTPKPQPPIVVTGAASGVSGSAASVAGSVDPSGLAAAFVVEFGTSTAFGSITPPASVPTGAGVVPVSASFTGLTAGTTYFYRVVATNSAGTSFGSVGSFTTVGSSVAPAVVTGAPVSVSPSGAVLAASVDPEGSSTAFTFEYGTSTSLGQIAPVVELDSAGSPEAVSGSLTGLAANTNYLYRVVATNAAGTSFGVVRSFTTGPGGAPVVSKASAGSVTSSGAVLSGSIDSLGEAATFAFEYGPTTSFGSLSAIDRTEATAGPQQVSLPVSGLAAGTTYIFRLVATDADGTTSGPTATFTTAAP